MLAASEKTPPPALWCPIEDLPPDWQPLLRDATRQRVASWRPLREFFPSETLERFTAQFTRRWAIATGQIEGLYQLDRGTTETLIAKGIHASYIGHDSVQGRSPEATAAMLLDHQDALEGLFAFVKDEQALTLHYIRQVHQVLTRNQDTATGLSPFGQRVEIPLLRGAWKQYPNNPTRPDGTLHIYCPPEQVQPQMEQLLAWHTEHLEKGVSPLVEAAWLHHRFVQIHPFQDGNGRMARILASLLLLRAGWLPLNVEPGKEREDYITALEQADGGDLVPLIELFARLQQQGLEEAFAFKAEAQRAELQAGVDSLVDQIHSYAAKGFSVPSLNAFLKWSETLLDHAHTQLTQVAKTIKPELEKANPEWMVGQWFARETGRLYDRRKNKKANPPDALSTCPASVFAVGYAVFSSGLRKHFIRFAVLLDWGDPEEEELEVCIIISGDAIEDPAKNPFAHIPGEPFRFRSTEIQEIIFASFQDWLHQKIQLFLQALGEVLAATLPPPEEETPQPSPGGKSIPGGAEGAG